MAVKWFEEKINEYVNIYIFTENQSAIQTIDSPKRQSGQYIIKKIMDTIERINEIKPTCNIHIEWVPGHENIEDNEQADKVGNEPSEPSDEHDLTSRAERDVFLLVAHEQREHSARS